MYFSLCLGEFYAIVQIVEDFDKQFFAAGRQVGVRPDIFVIEIW